MAGAFTKDVETRLWIPGVNTHDLRVKRIAIAIKDYDPALNLAKHEITGDWVVIIGENGFPVFGFGTELPEVHEVAPALARHDIKRHGKEMMAALEAQGAKQRLVKAQSMDQIHWQMAERYEHARRQELEGRRSAGGRARNGNGMYQRGVSSRFPTTAV